MQKDCSKSVLYWWTPGDLQNGGTFDHVRRAWLLCVTRWTVRIITKCSSQAGGDWRFLPSGHCALKCQLCFSHLVLNLFGQFSWLVGCHHSQLHTTVSLLSCFCHCFRAGRDKPAPTIAKTRHAWSLTSLAFEDNSCWFLGATRAPAQDRCPQLT